MKRILIIIVSIGYFVPLSAYSKTGDYFGIDNVFKLDDQYVFTTYLAKSYLAPSQYPIIIFDKHKLKFVEQRFQESAWTVSKCIDTGKLVYFFRNSKKIGSDPSEKCNLLMKYDAAATHENTVHIIKGPPIRIEFKKGSNVAQFFNKNSDIGALHIYEAGTIFITPEGYFSFTGDVDVLDNLVMYSNRKRYPISFLFDVFYRPDLVQAKFRGENIKNIVGDLTLSEVLKSPPPTVTISKTSDITDASSVEINYSIKDEGGGIGEIRIFNNNKLIWSDGSFKEAVLPPELPVGINKKRLASKTLNQKRGLKVKAVQGQSKNLITRHPSKKSCRICSGKLNVDVIPGEENEIRVVAFNGSNVIQSAPSSVRLKSILKRDEPHLWVLAIGIDEFLSVSNLNNARNDAENFVDRYQNLAGSLFDKNKIHIYKLLDREATKKKIKDTLDEIATKSKSTDKFVWFMASHGLIDENGMFSVVPSDLKCIGPSNNKCSVTSNTLTSNDILEASKVIPAMHQLLILDTCYSGSLNNQLSGLYEARMSVLAKNMGLHLYASAKSNQEAIDGVPGGNGAFTSSILRGFSGNAKDENIDNNISIIELGKYIQKDTIATVNALNDESIHQTPLVIHFGKDIPLYQISDSVINAHNTKRR